MQNKRNWLRGKFVIKKIKSITSLEDFGRVRLSQNFFMRDFMYSEISNFHGIPNIPDAPELAIEAGSMLCNELLEPLKASFGHIAIRSSYRSSEINGYGSDMQKQGKPYKCASNESNYAKHIWDKRDADGYMGATACITIPWFIDYYENGGDWRALAWWIHDHLPYSKLYFFPKLCAFNINWHENPERNIGSFIAPKGTLTKKGMENNTGDHSEWYKDLPRFRK